MYAYVLIDEEYRNILPLGELFEGSLDGWYVRLCGHEYSIESHSWKQEWRRVRTAVHDEEVLLLVLTDVADTC